MPGTDNSGKRLYPEAGQECLRCFRVRKIKARAMCASCYQVAWRRGEIGRHFGVLPPDDFGQTLRDAGWWDD